MNNLETVLKDKKLIKSYITMREPFNSKYVTSQLHYLTYKVQAFDLFRHVIEKVLIFFIYNLITQNYFLHKKENI